MHEILQCELVVPFRAMVIYALSELGPTWEPILVNLILEITVISFRKVIIFQDFYRKVTVDQVEWGKTPYVYRIFGELTSWNIRNFENFDYKWCYYAHLSFFVNF